MYSFEFDSHGLFYRIMRLFCPQSQDPFSLSALSLLALSLSAISVSSPIPCLAFDWTHCGILLTISHQQLSKVNSVLWCTVDVINLDWINRNYSADVIDWLQCCCYIAKTSNRKLVVKSVWGRCWQLLNVCNCSFSHIEENSSLHIFTGIIIYCVGCM